MNRKLMVGLVLGGLACMSCATASHGSLIRYHHGSPNGDAFWMTVALSATKQAPKSSENENVFSSADSEIQTSLWYCRSANVPAPVCTQVQMASCDPKVMDCTVVSDWMNLEEMPSSRNCTDCK